MSDETIWDFSLRLYAAGDFASTAIALQDEYGADVDILLYLCFAASQARAVDQTTASRIDAAIRPWREEVVKPVRALRRRLKAGVTPVQEAVSDALRADVMNVELACERAELDALVRLFDPARLPAAATGCDALARANLHAYAATLGGLPGDRLDRLMVALRTIQSA